ncbi:hypothetical protein AGMMS49975_27760 [Clostridia bacterium]|nr:hypothetical protein AGMMS49975_27760 [Clostridia bacterium]
MTISRKSGRDVNDASAYKINPALGSVGNAGIRTSSPDRNYADVYQTPDSHSVAVVTAANKINFTASNGKQISSYPDIRILTNGRRSSYGENFKEVRESKEEYQERTGVPHPDGVEAIIFKTKSESATEYLISARRSAKANFTEALGVGRYDEATNLYDFGDGDTSDFSNKLDSIALQEPEFEPEFELSDMPQVAGIQKDYIKRRREIYALTDSISKEDALTRQDEELSEKIEALFGVENEGWNLNPDFIGSFNCVNIAAHMTLAHSFFTNETDLQKTFKLSEADYELFGDDFEAKRFNDGTIKFDTSSARDLPYKGSPNPRHGLIPTAYKAAENGLIALGYTAYILDRFGEHSDKTMEQRTRLRGYEQLMSERLKSTIRDTVTGNNKSDFSNETGLNYVYRHLHSERLSFDFEEEMARLGRDLETIDALVKTQPDILTIQLHLQRQIKA